STKLFHAYGMGNNLTVPYWAGATTVLMSGRPTPDAVLDTIERHRPTLFFSAPTLYNAILRTQGSAERDLSSVRRCVSAAESLPAEVFRRWRDTYGVTILDGIGSTEMLHIYCSNAEGDLKPGSSGKPVPGYEIELRDWDDTPSKQGETGNLLVRGGSSLAFYWHQSEKTRRSLRGEWFFTGDRYRMDSDGFYWYEGRADDMMKVSGM
ncbi:MAG: AMP-binding protein, partial [Pseudonocardiaceae bacterium]